MDGDVGSVDPAPSAPSGPDHEPVDSHTPFADLVHAAASGAPWACRELWERFAPGVAGYARSRGSLEPDDLTSEVFLAVFKGLPGFRGDEGGFRALLFTIARRRLVDEHRARGKRPGLIDWDPAADERTTPSAEDEVLEALGDAHARRVLDGLAPDQREVLVLRIFGDLTVDQVAAVLGKRPGAVKALQRRGLAALRRNIEGLVPGEEGLR